VAASGRHPQLGRRLVRRHVRGNDRAALRAFAAGKVAHYKIPRYVHVVDGFPMTVRGVVRKVEMHAASARLFGPKAPDAVEDT
jgi:acyl-CoA synthetase (AMP-forming)/AMP-acid ligase II